MEPTTALIGALVALFLISATILLMRSRIERARLDSAVARTQLEEARRQVADLTAERDAAVREREVAREVAQGARREVDLAAQRLKDGTDRVADMELFKTEGLQAMKAAALETTQLLSSKLLEDHKRESEAAKKEGEALVKETTAQLFQRFESVTRAVAELKGQVGVAGDRVDTVWRALKSPGGSGYFAEIGLANTLLSFGLVEGRDFALQYTTEDAVTGRRLRPDAVVFLPGDSALVIDSKASKALIEIAETEGSTDEATAYQNLARTMNQHLRALADKDYRNAVAAAWREAGRGERIARVLSVMYLPNEGAIEKLQRADPDFAAKAARHEIIPVGPAGLAGLIGFASIEISLIRQIENQERIVAGSEALLESLTVALGHAVALGRNVRGAADAYERFARSVNGRLLARGRRLTELGLRPGKTLPASLPAYHVQALDAVIDGEAEETGTNGSALDDAPILVERAGN